MMSDYRRAFQPGGTFFFTLVTERRSRFLTNDNARSILRGAFKLARDRFPFDVRALVLLPDHLHTIWTLPDDSHDFSTRIAFLKKAFTKAWLAVGGIEQPRSQSRQQNRRRGVWQRRFWEHLIRDEKDFKQHCAYIHFNPVKHGLVTCPHEWEFSSFNRFVREGVYNEDWQCACMGRNPGPLEFDGMDGAAIE